MGIKSLIKKAIIRLLPDSVKEELRRPLSILKRPGDDQYGFINVSFSQEGEDLILARLFENKYNGFYVDVGAHHPYRLSNTYKFYSMGWNGINIDALPGSMKPFNELRPRDINIEAAILRDSSVPVKYYVFDEPAINTFDESLAKKWVEESTFRLIQTMELVPQRLSDILDKHLPVDQEIDFLTVDVEGMDLEVMYSNDWRKYRPRYVIAESLCSKLYDDLHSPLTVFLKDNGYHLISKTANSLIYCRD